MNKAKPLEVGQLFKNRYRIISILGQGGMGKVYLAEDQRIKNKKWAIKEVENSRFDKGSFIKEATILAKLDHQYLPKIVDYYYENDFNRSFLVMDYIEGNSLESITENGGPLFETQIIKYALQLCNLFNYLHNEQQEAIIYRDLKPTHVLIDEQDNIKLIDFGIARHYIFGKEIDTVQLGSVKYAAPEQFTDKQSDHRADLYSFGALLYYLFSKGKHYYTLRKPLFNLRNDLPPIVYTIIDKLLQFSPDDRYQNILDVQLDLQLAANYYNDQTTLLVAHQDQIKKVSTLTINTRQVSENTSQIMVCALSKCAGSTFITINLAKFISENNIKPNVVEIPFRPYLFDYLGVERSATLVKEENIFYSVAHELCERKPLINEGVYLAKGIAWTLVDPRRPLISESEWDDIMMLNLLYVARKKGISLIDVGDYIEHPAVANAAMNVDCLMVVIDPILISIAQNLRRLFKLRELAQAGVKVKLIINNWTESIPKRELLKFFDFAPIYFCPNVEQAYIHRAAFNGNILYEYKEVSRLLQSTLSDLAADFIIVNPDNQKKLRSKYNFLRR